MDPVALAELWWIAPAAVGAAGIGGWGVRRAAAPRRIAYDAARAELRDAITDHTTAQHVQRVARTELGRVGAERAAGRATPAEVAAAKRALQAAQRDVRAAAATVKARRTRADAERARIPKRSEPNPVERLLTAHDTVLVRWMQYETDPAKAIAYPLMSDTRAPAMRGFLSALDRAQSIRPSDGGARPSPAEYIAYRDAVAGLEQAFGAAERAAGAASDEHGSSSSWQETAQQMVALSADALERAAAAAASALATWRARR